MSSPVVMEINLCYPGSTDQPSQPKSSHVYQQQISLWFPTLTSWPGRSTRSRSAWRTRPRSPAPRRRSRFSTRHLREFLGFLRHPDPDCQSSGGTGSVVWRNIRLNTSEWLLESWAGFNAKFRNVYRCRWLMMMKNQDGAAMSDCYSSSSL